METVLNALKAMEKATTREVASRMNIEPKDALDVLNTLEERGEARQVNGIWRAITNPAAVKNTAPKEPSKHVSVSDVMALLEKHGPKTSLELATLAGIESKRVAPMLTHHMTNGRVLREKVDSKFVYSVKTAAPAKPGKTTTQESKEPAAPEKSVTEIVQDIPAFTARADDLIIPSARFITSEIRRTKAKLANLEKLREAVRSIRKHGALVQELAQ